MRSQSVLAGDEGVGAVHLAQLGLLDLAGWVAGDGGEDDSAGALVAGKVEAEGVHLVLGERHAGLDLDDGGGDLAEALVGKADHGDVLHLGIGAQEVLDLDGVEVLAAGDDHVLGAVHEVDEPVAGLGHVACSEPAVRGEYLLRRLGVLVVALHHAGALDGEFADLAGGHLGAVWAHDLRLPAVARHADRADMGRVLHAEVHGAGPGGLGEAVVRVVVVVGEHALPALDEGGRNGLRTDVHEPPLGEGIVRELHVAALDGVENVLRPWDEQPNDRALLLAHGAENPFRLHSLEEHGLAAHEKAAEPVHLGARVVERRNAEEHVVLRLAVVRLLHAAGVHEGVVLQDDGLGEARRAGAEVDGGLVVVVEGYGGSARGAVAHEVAVGLREGGAVVAHVEAQPGAGNAVYDLLHAADELGAEDKGVGVGELEAVLYLVRGVSEVERHGEASGAQHAEVYGQPLKAVHEKDGHLVTLLEPAAEEEVREAVRLLVELAPRDLAAERLDGA